MPYLGRAPGVGNNVTGNLKVSGTISAESINDKLALNGSDASTPQAAANDHFIFEDGGTDGSGTNAGENVLLEDSTRGSAEGVELSSINAGTSTSGQLLQSQGIGNALTFATIASGGLKSVQVFTSDGTYTKPSGVNLVKVTVVAGGGGGSGGGGTGNMPGGGGGGGGTAIEVIDVSAVSTVAVTVGAGGAATSGVTGNNGASSSFGSYCSATGGTGGSASIAAGGAGSGGDYNITGMEGQQRRWIYGHIYEQGSGGFSFVGRGGYDAVAQTTGDDGEHGGGGSGGWQSNNGGAGGTGIVIVEEYG